MISISPLRRMLYSCAFGSPVLAYYPIRSYLADRSNTVEPTGKLRKLIDETAKDQNIKPNDFELLVRDELNFKLFPNWAGKKTMIIPKYLTFESIDDLNQSYLNSLLKRDFGVELKDREQWFSEEGKQIISSFLLTDQACKFLLSRNMYSLKNENILSYYTIAALLFYLPTQLIKWYKDFVIFFSHKSKAFAKNPRTAKPPSKFLYLTFMNRKRILSATVATSIFIVISFYYAIGLKNDRDADALTLSHGLAHALKIKSKASLIDFNYYSGGEEAYRKISERYHSINSLFFDGINDFERFFRRIPITKNGNHFTYISNRVSVQTALKTINEWEKISGS